MAEQNLREKLRGEIQVVDAATLLPHHRRDALLIVKVALDILEVALALANDDSARVAAWIEDQEVYKPSLAQLSDWCVDLDLRLQFVILQPYVLAQVVEGPKIELS